MKEKDKEKGILYSNITKKGLKISTHDIIECTRTKLKIKGHIASLYNS
jgi:hypothetical protein